MSCGLFVCNTQEKSKYWQPFFLFLFLSLSFIRCSSLAAPYSTLQGSLCSVDSGKRLVIRDQQNFGPFYGKLDSKWPSDQHMSRSHGGGSTKNASIWTTMFCSPYSFEEGYAGAGTTKSRTQPQLPTSSVKRKPIKNGMNALLLFDHYDCNKAKVR